MVYCTRCDRHFTSAVALKQHQMYSGNHHFCDDCDRDFKTDDSLIQHFVHSSAHHYCEDCSRDFDDDDDLESHYEDEHYYCNSCSEVFYTEDGLHEHNQEEHWYCVSCKRLFNNENNLNQHLRSSVHLPRIYICPGKKCKGKFISEAGLVLHCESGACPSRVTRELINRVVVAMDRNNVITNPARLIRASDGSYSPATATVAFTFATSRSWNGTAFECILCHKEFRTLAALDAHIRSPAHADKIYRCPSGWSGCNAEFKTLSGLFQHVESGCCGVARFRREMRDVMGSLIAGMKILAM